MTRRMRITVLAYLPIKHGSVDRWGCYRFTEKSVKLVCPLFLMYLSFSSSRVLPAISIEKLVHLGVSTFEFFITSKQESWKFYVGKVQVSAPRVRKSSEIRQMRL